MHEHIVKYLVKGDKRGESYKHNYLKLCRKILNGKSFLVADLILNLSE